MRMRFCAIMRRPAVSMSALMAPVRFRSVASGLRIEKVRSTAMRNPFFQRVAGSRRLIARPSAPLKQRSARLLAFHGGAQLRILDPDMARMVHLHGEPPLHARPCEHGVEPALEVREISDGLAL